MANKIPRVPVREQDPAIRATNFEEVCYGYDLEEATLEASRCLRCKNPRCVAACPVSARAFGNVNDPESRISRRIAVSKTEKLLPHKGTKPNFFVVVTK